MFFFTHNQFNSILSSGFIPKAGIMLILKKGDKNDC